ncbi:EamA family transporter [Nocardia jejuensis]|uniref:EamA family transporter n=1 Tax=Nocardia jejuensis TaxID=328049 RepID=UPI00082BE486
MPLRALLTLVSATSLWGVSSALMAMVATGFASAALVSAGGAMAVLVFAIVRRERPLRALASDWRLYLSLGVLEVVNLVLYMGALHLGPLPMMVALHLAAPIVLVGARIVRSGTVSNPIALTEIALVTAAIVLVVGGHPGSSTTVNVFAGCLLALGSAGCVALLITIVARNSRDRAPLSSAGLQLAIASVLGAPLLTIAPPSGEKSMALLAIGAFFLGPGFVGYWWALRTLDAPTAGIVGLNEAVTASIVGAVVAGNQLTVPVVGAGILVLIAVGLEVRMSPKPDVPQRRTMRRTRDPYPRRWSRRHC